MTDSIAETILRVSARATEFWLFRTYSDWNCHIRWENADTKLEIKKYDPDMATALHQAVEAFDAIASNGIPQLSLPSPVDGDFVEKHTNTVRRDLDDEIPF